MQLKQVRPTLDRHFEGSARCVKLIELIVSVGETVLCLRRLWNEFCPALQRFPRGFSVSMLAIDCSKLGGPLGIVRIVKLIAESASFVPRAAIKLLATLNAHLNFIIVAATQFAGPGKRFFRIVIAAKLSIH